MSKILNDLKDVKKKPNATGNVYQPAGGKKSVKANKFITFMFFLSVIGGGGYFYWKNQKPAVPAAAPVLGPKEQIAGRNSEAILLFKNQKFAEARDIWLALTTSKEADVYVNLALAYKKLGEVGKSEEALKAALELDPKHPVAMNNLALLLAQTERAEQAQDILKKTLDTAGAPPVFIYNLAAVYENANQLGLSIEYYKQYVSHPKADPKVAQKIEQRLPRLNSLYTYSKRTEEGG